MMANGFGGIPFDVCSNFAPFQGVWPPWTLNVLLALVISAIVLVLLYMFAQIIRHVQLEAWSKLELFQIFVTALIAGSAIVTIAGMCSFSPAILTLNPTDPSSPGYRYIGANGQPLTVFQAADSYLEWLRTSTVDGFMVIFFLNNVIARVTSITWHMRPTGVGFSTQPLGGLAPLNSALMIVLNGVMLTFMITLVQTAILKYINIAMLTYLLPMGVLFRSFAPTRKFGGALIGLALGMFIFFPIMLVFNDFAVRGIITAANSQTSNAIISNYVNNFNADSFRDRGISEGTGSTGGSSVVTGGSSNNSGENAAHGVLAVFRIAFNLVVAAIILMAINFAVLITVIKELSRIFGEEVDASNLTRMI